MSYDEKILKERVSKAIDLEIAAAKAKDVRFSTVVLINEGLTEQLSASYQSLKESAEKVDMVIFNTGDSNGNWNTVIWPKTGKIAHNISMIFENNRFESIIDGRDDYDEIEAEAIANESIVGRVFYEHVADGKVPYLVYAKLGSAYYVQALPNPDNYVSPAFGSASDIDFEWVERKIAMDNSIKAMFASRQSLKP